MDAGYIFLGGIGILGVVAIILGILNIVSMSFLNRKIANLEDVVEKKTLEQDAIKKDKQPLSSIQNDKQFEPASHNFSDNFESSQNNEIEIVRNVRNDTQSLYIPQEPETPVNSPYQAIQEPQEMEMDSNPDVLEIVEDEQENAEYQPDIFTLQVYAPEKRNADFAGVWNKLSKQLGTIKSGQIHFDFTNIVSLSSKELYYLEQFALVIEKNGCNLFFINTIPAVAELLAARQSLRTYLP